MRSACTNVALQRDAQGTPVAITVTVAVALTLVARLIVVANCWHVFN